VEGKEGNTVASPFVNALGQSYYGPGTTTISPAAYSFVHPQGLQGVSQRMQTALAAAAARVGGIIPSLTVTSGYRSPAYNKAVGGARNSTHLRGDAIDIALDGLSRNQQQALVGSILQQPAVTGFGYYPGSNSIHFDVGHGTRAYWGRDYTSRSWQAPSWMDQAVKSWASGKPVQDLPAAGVSSQLALAADFG
jgi:hypothetical protein